MSESVPFRTYADVPDIRGKKVLLRTSLNVPIIDGVVSESDLRLQKAVETAQMLSRRGARTIIAGYIGRDPSLSLEPVAHALQASLPLTFTGEIFGEKTTSAISAMHDGDIVLIENIRQDSRETKNDPEFARALAALADVVVLDAFADAHRSHASIVGVPQYVPSVAGPLFVAEYTALMNARMPTHPALFILGGAKFETKEPLVTEFLETYEHVFIGGALAHDFYKTLGSPVGKSLVSGVAVPDALAHNERIILPSDVVVEDASGTRTVKMHGTIGDTDVIGDCGPQTLERLKTLIKDASFILWNGPLGNYEKGFSEGTEALARLIAESDAHSIVGGGDTLESILKLNLLDSFSFASTAGGAMLELLEHGTIAGVEALKTSPAP